MFSDPGPGITPKCTGVQGQAKVTAAAEVRLRSLQDAGPVRKARARAGLGAPPVRALTPTRQRARPATPTLGTRRRGGSEEWAPGPGPRRHLGQQAAEARQGAGWPRPLPAGWPAPGASPP